jgi:hypothetical protein
LVALALLSLACDDDDKRTPAPSQPACGVKQVLAQRASAREAHQKCARGDAGECEREREHLRAACDCGNRTSCDILERGRVDKATSGAPPGSASTPVASASAPAASSSAPLAPPP